MRPDTHSLIGAYVLDALTTAERSDFEDHLDHCAACRGELAGLRTAAAALAPPAQQPPAALRMRVLAATTQVAQQRRPPRPYARFAAAAAAVVLTAGAAFGIRAWTDDRPPSAADVFVADDAVTHTLGSAAGPVRVATSADTGYAAIDLRRLEHPSLGQRYQIWWIDTGEPRSVAVGTDLALVPLRDGALAVSVEPAGGSPQPTSDPIVVAPIGG